MALVNHGMIRVIACTSVDVARIMCSEWDVVCSLTDMLHVVLISLICVGDDHVVPAIQYLKHRVEVGW